MYLYSYIYTYNIHEHTKVGLDEDDRRLRLKIEHLAYAAGTVFWRVLSYINNVFFSPILLLLLPKYHNIILTVNTKTFLVSYIHMKLTKHPHAKRIYTYIILPLSTQIENF